ncbi:uncharacterized protein STEHIDRAFT_152615 [Stereum hirsutum FP-91666 SS1]|uniref:uncharacterized protein n=1 Tax=Stereum hirsutum (strain FP-91666) TaxID=721885 RepID=UPI000440A631|nr:uncharacterized protein STEHIDRAFT_152615 [Stereum hirsutum FP-91666 SS1]EIM90931.1 hypothetical protein STEHIDRAFT_152615 [Stereum hirsutum FP-91666 SS1]
MSTFAQSTWGPILVGTFINILLFGVTVAQLYMYHQSYTRDKFWLRCFIGILFVADTINTVFDMQLVYDALINHFSDESYLEVATWVFRTDPAGVIGMAVQLFFAWRVKVLTNSIWATILVGFCAFVSCCAGVATAIAVGIVPRFVEFQTFKPAVIIWLALSALCDCLITLILVSYLRKQKSAFVVTDGIVDRIIRLTVQTGLITSIVAVAALIAFLASPNGLHLVFNMPLAKLYTNSLLSSLNARTGWAYNSSSQPDHQANTLHGQSSKGARRRQDVLTFEGTTTAPEVFVNVEQHEMSDSIVGANKRGSGDYTFDVTTDSKAYP